MTLGREIIDVGQVKAARALLAWSQQDLAKAAGIATSTVADFERGHREPNPDSLNLIRGAAEKAGVRFTKGGVVLEAAMTPPPMRNRGSAPVRWIDGSDLIDWAQRRSGQDGMPELISRLIRASNGFGAQLSFPSGDSVQQSGWDGTCFVENGFGPLPSGQSVWEIGTQRTGVKGKAEGDYLKRTANPGHIVPSETTFVFATPQRWSGKKAWESAKRAEGIWKDVRALDNDDFVHWLELFPVASHWLAIKLGKRHLGIRELSEAWDQWSLATATPLSQELILEGRDENAKSIHTWLRSPPSVLAIQSESVEEVNAFLYASISELPPVYREAYLSRTLVTSNDELATSLSDAPSPLIVVMQSSPDGIPQTIAAKGHHVFVAFGSDMNAPNDIIRLSRPRRSMIERGLQTMGFDREKAHTLARDAGQSLTILRRLLPPAPGRRPIWANSSPSRSFIAALLAGAWNESLEGDRTVLEKLAGKTYAEVIGDLRPVLGLIDSPIRKSGDNWRVISPKDCWLLLSKYLQEDEAKTYFDIFKTVFQTTDPRFYIDPGERWMASTPDKRPPHSPLLRMGLLDTLLLFALYGDKANHVSDCSGKVDVAVASLLDNAPSELWWSLQDDFKKLAEASPTTFLRSLTRNLNAASKPLAVLFEEDTGGVSGAQHLSGLLWALESLAWSPDYFSLVCDVLAGLDDIDPGGKWTNRPANSLRHLFLLWNPQTYVPLAQRLTVIDELRVRHPKSSWKLLLSILPKGHDFATPTAHPQWRDFRPDQTETITYPLMAMGSKAVSERVLTDVGSDPERWKHLIEVFTGFDADVRAELGLKLVGTISQFTDAAARKSLRSDLRRLLNQHRQFYPEANWAVSEKELAPFQQAYDLLKPSDIIDDLMWIFESGAIPPVPYSKDWKTGREEGEKAQVDAARQILNETGRDGIFRLANSIDSAGWLGRALGEIPVSDSERAEFLKVGFCSDRPQEWNLAHGLMWQGIGRGNGPTTAELLSVAKRENWGDEALVRILKAAPSDQDTWALAEQCSDDVQTEYWKRVDVMMLPDTDVDQAAKNLLAVGRPRQTVHLFGARLAAKPNSQLVVQALREAVSDETPLYDTHNEGVMLTHNIAELLDYLEKDATVDIKTIVQLEWTYYQALRYSSHPPRNLDRALAEDPVFFLQILSLVYLPSKESGVIEPPVENRQAAESMASQGWRLLHDWKHVPGANDAGVIDPDKLKNWVQQVRAGAAEIGRLEICDSRIGDVLAAALPDQDGLWPPKPVRELIERLASEDLEDGIRTGLVNKRGVTVRMPDDGGGQERALAAQYRRNGKEVSLTAPRTAALLEMIAKRYDAYARHEDEEVDHREWY